MSPRELLKALTSSEHLMVLRITKHPENGYLVKRMIRATYPSWEMLYHAKDKQSLDFELDFWRKRFKVLISTDKMTSKEFDMLESEGFRLIRPVVGEKFQIQEYNSQTHRWKVTESFQSRGWLNSRLRELGDNSGVLNIAD